MAGAKQAIESGLYELKEISGAQGGLAKWVKETEDGLTTYMTQPELEIWYHEETGTTSALPVINHDYYAKKRDFHPEPTPKWWEKNKHNIECPISTCQVKTIRLGTLIDENDVAKTAEILGLKDEVLNLEEIKRAAVLLHYQIFHPNTYAMLLRRGVVTPEESKRLRMGT